MIRPMDSVSIGIGIMFPVVFMEMYSVAVTLLYNGDIIVTIVNEITEEVIDAHAIHAEEASEILDEFERSDSFTRELCMFALSALLVNVPSLSMSDFRLN